MWIHPTAPIHIKELYLDKERSERKTEQSIVVKERSHDRVWVSSLLSLYGPFVLAWCSVTSRETRYPNSCFTWFQFSLLSYLLLRKRFIFSILIKLNWWVNPKEYSTKKSKCFWRTMQNVFHNAFLKAMFFSDVHESYFTYAWAGNACLLFSIFPIIRVSTRARQTALSVMKARFLRLSILF